MLAYLLGPILALFPRRWRKLLPAGSAMECRRAAVLSGFGEAVIALIALIYWYSHYMTLMVDHGLDAAITGKLPPGVTDHEIGFTALVIWATHPLTWLLAYAGVEGSVRLVGAAFTETNLGIFPLFVLDKVIGMITEARRKHRQQSMARRKIFPRMSGLFERRRWSGDFQRSRVNYALAEARPMNSLKFARAGERQIGTRRARCATRIPFTGWKRVP